LKTSRFGIRVNFGPLLIILCFWGFTYGLYISDIVLKYPERNDFLLFLYVTVCSASLVFGYLFGIAVKVKPADPINSKTIAFVGFFSIIVLFVPIVYVYTGSGLGQFFELLTSPAAAYNSMQEAVSEGREQRLPIILSKIVLSPFIVAALPYFAFQFFRYKRHKYLLLSLIFLSISMSVFRGTDKEIFDAFIILFAVFISAKPNIFRMRFFNIKFMRSIVLLSLSIVLVLSVFSFRKSERLEAATTLCFKGTEICNSVDPIGDPVGFGGYMLVRYLTQGYYGLAVAFDAEFESGFGMGHSRPLQFLGGKVFGLDFSGNVVGQLDSLGWASKGLWSSGFVWLANDVPISFVPVLILMVAFLVGRAWKQVISDESFVSLIIFVYLFFTLVYMPANLQLAQSGDLYLGFLFWLIYSIVRPSRIKI